MNDNDLFDLVYNGRTGDFEYSCAKDKDERDSLTDSLFPTPPQSLEELIGGVVNEIARAFWGVHTSGKAKAWRISILGL